MHRHLIEINETCPDKIGDGAMLKTKSSTKVIRWQCVYLTNKSTPSIESSSQGEGTFEDKVHSGHICGCTSEQKLPVEM